MNLVIASNNKGKIAEIKEILKNQFDNIYSLSELNVEIDVVEDGETFFDNAYKKAKEVSEATKLAALSDDSGLIVSALNGAPGVHSARYAGENATDKQNNEKLLSSLSHEKNPKAKFFSSVVIHFPDGTFVSGEGEAEGEILPRGVGTDGFGYDPLFYSFDLKKTFAEASMEEKNKISHRKKALDDLLKNLITAKPQKK